MSVEIRKNQKIGELSIKYYISSGILNLDNNYCPTTIPN